MRTSALLSLTVCLTPCIAIGCAGGSYVPDGSGGMGGADGGSGAGGPSAADPAGPKDPDAVLRAAVFMGSCQLHSGINRVMNRYYTRKGGDASDAATNARTQCFKDKANGCAAILDCVGMRIDRTGPCDTSCAGEVLVACDDVEKFQIDCSRLGLSCSAKDGDCIKKPVGPACTMATYISSCDAGAPKACLSEGETLGPTCADYGLVCGKGMLSGEAACVGEGAACQEQVGSTISILFDQGGVCAMDTLKTCINGGEHALDCKSLATGFTCQTTATSSFCGLDAACDPGAATDATCEGDSVVVCNAGRVEKVDCRALGFTGCDPMLGACSPNDPSKM